MSQRIIQETECDFCRRTTRAAEFDRWFMVIKKPALQSNTVKNACLECGHKVHTVLDQLGIEHTFNCMQYSRIPGYGEISYKCVI